MSKHCHFYATKNDLLAITERVESKLPIKYVRFGGVTKLPPETFNSAAQIPNLGIASHESGTGCEKFLVFEKQTTVRAERLKTITAETVEKSDMKNKEPLRALIGLDRFAIDQLYNPDTITFNPGGLWKGEILLSGNLGAAHNTETSEKLMKLFRAAIKSNFTRVRAFWVSPQALEMLKAGKRLTIAEQSPPEYNLALET